jgi:hypothetical protein
MIDCRGIPVADTPEMAKIALKISELQAKYKELLKEEQCRQVASVLSESGFDGLTWRLSGKLIRSAS